MFAGRPQRRERRDSDRDDQGSSQSHEGSSKDRDSERKRELMKLPESTLRSLARQLGIEQVSHYPKMMLVERIIEVEKMCRQT